MKKLLLAVIFVAALAVVFQIGRATNNRSPQEEARVDQEPTAQSQASPTVASEEPTPASTEAPDPTTVAPTVVPSTEPLWTFDGTPGEPLPFGQHANAIDFDVQVHSRDQPSWGDNALPSTSYDHGDDCAGSQDWRTFPQHANTSYDGAVFVCNNHLMTANIGAGYGAVVLTPNRLVDLSQGTTTVTFRMSTFRHSDRDWVEFTFSPWDVNNTIPCPFCPDLQGSPVQAVMLDMGQEKIGDGEPGSGFVLYVNGQQMKGVCPCYESVLEPDKARRDLFEIEFSDTHLVMRMPEYDLTLVDASFESLGWDKAIFQMIHHSYNPEKGSPMHGETAKANTWHWDEIGISPSTPFQIVKADQRALLRKGPGDMGSMQFAGPAPENAYLRFAALANPEVSFDGGATWTKTSPQPSTKKQIATESYFLPVPPGTQQVAFRANCVEWYCEEMHVKDVAFWAVSGAPAPPASAAVPARDISPPATGNGGLSLFRCDLE